MLLVKLVRTSRRATPTTAKKDSVSSSVVSTSIDTVLPVSKEGGGNVEEIKSSQTAIDSNWNTRIIDAGNANKEIRKSQGKTKTGAMQKSSSSNPTVKDKLSVEISTEVSCKIYLNNKFYTELGAGDILKPLLKPGTYPLRAISNDGNRSFEKVLTVTPYDMGKSMKVKIIF